MTPIGRISSIRSLRLNGAALAWRVQSGLKTICGALRLSAHQAAMQFGALGRSAVEQHHVGVPGEGLVELVPDQAMIIELEPAGEGDLGAGVAGAPRSRRGVWRRGSRDCR